MSHPSVISSDDLDVSSSMMDPSPDHLQVIADEIVYLLRSKRRDYGTQNIDEFGEFGILVRINDKVARLKNLMQGEKVPNYESIDDTWRDIAGYALLALELKERGMKK